MAGITQEANRAHVEATIDLARREMAYIDTTASLYKDGECVFCHNDPIEGVHPSHVCVPFTTDQEGYRDTYHRLIDEARELWALRRQLHDEAAS